MSMSDPISDMLTRIRNAQQAEKTTVTMPSSKLKVAIAKLLQDEGYVEGFNGVDHGGKPILEGPDAWTPEAPSAIPYDTGWAVPHAMTKDDIKRCIGEFAAATKRVERIGYDLIELHAAHGYLIAQFLSRASNRRADAYRGDTLEGRIRFLVEVVEEVRTRCGASYPVGIRLSADEHTPGGMTLEDTLERLAARCEGVWRMNPAARRRDEWSLQMHPQDRRAIGSAMLLRPRAGDRAVGRLDLFERRSNHGRQEGGGALADEQAGGPDGFPGRARGRNKVPEPGPRPVEGDHRPGGRSVPAERPVPLDPLAVRIGRQPVRVEAHAPPMVRRDGQRPGRRRRSSRARRDGHLRDLFLGQRGRHQRC